MYVRVRVGFLFIARQEPRFRVFEDKVLRIFAYEREEIREELEIFYKRTCLVYAFDEICMMNQWRTKGGGLGGFKHPPEILKISVESSIA